ncbi:MAG: ATP-binding protein [Acidobacteria bacterium]|nr:ATP-binding protein [Acidobacteriota bacterium]
MRSLFAKILLWFWAAIFVAVVGAAVITGLSREETEARPPFSRLVSFQLQEARHAYETGGRSGLTDFMKRFHSVFDAHGIFTDEAGRDVLSGRNYSYLVKLARGGGPENLKWQGHEMFLRFANDGHFWFFFLGPRRPPNALFLLPQDLWMLGAFILFCYLLAFYLTSPLRRLRKVVERFGQGDFSVRAGLNRRDEFGALSRTFDQMADRIQTLLGAERRLLLDISHELRSPLARLGVAVELARSGEDRESALNRIQKESDRLNSLVGGLLQVTRAEGDPASLRRESVRLDQLAAELAEDSSLEARARGCSIALDATDAVTAAGDPELLRRAVENILRNAIRYAPSGTPVEIWVGHADGKAVVRVRDYGPGVPEKDLPRIFDPFYRVGNDRDRSSGGVGLGLSIARRAVELHNGRLLARNADPGLVVEIEIPAG